jgi:hypothetical protein
VGVPFGMPPNRIIVPCWVSKAIAALQRSDGSEAPLRAYQVGPLVSSSQVDRLLELLTAAIPSNTTRRRIES